MFITSFVLGSVVFNSNMFNREIILYIISLFYIIIIGLKRKITIIGSSVFILIYTLNIIFAFYQGRNNNKNNGIKKISEENKPTIDEILNMGDYKGEKDINPAFKLGKEIELIQKKNSATDLYFEYMYMYIPLEQKQNNPNEQLFWELKGLKEDILNEQKSYANIKTYSEALNENMMLAKINIKKSIYIIKKKNGIKLNKNWSKKVFIFFPINNFLL